METETIQEFLNRGGEIKICDHDIMRDPGNPANPKPVREKTAIDGGYVLKRHKGAA